ncbi:MAG TPA: DUF1801 domain-containing protein, partial [Thermoanaerobaculia bacterium]|nr:DUF1801 domain-containing protein [Thermoanaerobaculia bacterium]
MKNYDPRFDAYIGKSAGFAKPVLRHLRKLVHQGCPEVEETMKWSHPAFLYGGKILCGMAAFKAHCTFGFWHHGMEAVLGSDGSKAGEAMGSLGRITNVDGLPADKTMLLYIRKAAALNESGASGRPRPGGKPAKARPVPADL